MKRNRVHITFKYMYDWIIFNLNTYKPSLSLFVENNTCL